jgi:hypothetical protein
MTITAIPKISSVPNSQLAQLPSAIRPNIIQRTPVINKTPTVPAGGVINNSPVVTPRNNVNGASQNRNQPSLVNPSGIKKEVVNPQAIDTGINQYVDPSQKSAVTEAVGKILKTNGAWRTKFDAMSTAQQQQAVQEIIKVAQRSLLPRNHPEYLAPNRIQPALSKAVQAIASGQSTTATATKRKVPEVSPLPTVQASTANDSLPSAIRPDIPSKKQRGSAKVVAQRQTLPSAKKPSSPSSTTAKLPDAVRPESTVRVQPSIKKTAALPANLPAPVNTSSVDNLKPSRATPPTPSAIQEQPYDPYLKQAEALRQESKKRMAIEASKQTNGQVSLVGNWNSFTPGTDSLALGMAQTPERNDATWVKDMVASASGNIPTYIMSALPTEALQDAFVAVAKFAQSSGLLEPSALAAFNQPASPAEQKAFKDWSAA